jgi:hypothetical protein
MQCVFNLANPIRKIYERFTYFPDTAEAFSARTRKCPAECDSLGHATFSTAIRFVSIKSFSLDTIGFTIHGADKCPVPLIAR